MFGLRARGDEARAVQATAWGSWGDDHQPTWAGANVTTSSSLQLLAVYGSVQFITNGIATLPVHVYEGEAEKIDTPRWIEFPFGNLNRVAWMTQVLSSILLDGNAYCYIQATERGRQLMPLDPAVVSIRSEQGRLVYSVNGAPIDTASVLHIPGIMTAGSLKGLSPVEAARQSIGQGMAAQEYGARFFGQGATLSGVIEAPADMPPGATEEMAKAWARKHSGKGKAHLPGVLTGGATWKPTSVTNDQAQFLETRQFTAAEIAGQMFLVDPSELGIPVSGTSLTYGNLEERAIRRVQVTFMPWIVRIEQALSSLLPDGQYLKINTNGILRGDTKTRYESYKIGREIDAIQLPEIRAWEDLPPLPEKPPAPPDLLGQIEAVGQLIRAGFTPEGALQAVGLPAIPHTGLRPVTVTPEEGGNAASV